MIEWISTKKYLPPFHNEVLLYIGDIEDCPMVAVGYMEMDGNFYFWRGKDVVDCQIIEDISHWSQLPEPPKPIDIA